RQIFQAMRPVFADLVQEVQRSLGHYTSLHRETRFKKLLALGNGFRLPGLQKYLEQNLNIPVHRLDGYNHLKTAGPADTPIFTENAMSFAVCYGLALQGLELTTIDANLLPGEIARERRWSAKRPWFAAAAAVLLAALAGPVWRSYADRSALEPGRPLATAKRVYDDLNRLRQARNQWVDQGKMEEQLVEKYLRLYGYRNLQPAVLGMISQCISKYATHQPRFGVTEAERADVLKQLQAKVPRHQRKIVIVEGLEMEFLPDYRQDSPSPDATMAQQEANRLPGGGPGLKVTLMGRTLLPRAQANADLLRPMLRRSEEIARLPQGNLPSPIQVRKWQVVRFLDMKATQGTESGAPERRSPTAMPRTDTEMYNRPAPGSSEEDKLEMPDLMFPGEDMSKDTRFEIRWILSIENDGLKPLESPRPDANEPD
ncbi:MAG TPA: pilus assembly protein PilM, partial [Phycisphaerae bacterium]|nr:pilus assembly protein PilM [Phycisphaerae bacterium]